jgi:exodeoxyribonuclease VII small subunit
MTNSPESQENDISFEEAIGRLESIVEQMNDQSLPLEKAIKLYEEGMELSKKLTDTIESAEQKVVEINKRLDAAGPAEQEEDSGSDFGDDMPF